MTRLWRGACVPGLLMLTVWLGGCGSNGLPPSGGASPAGGISLLTQINFTGAIAVRGSFTDTTTVTEASCRSYARTGTIYWAGPQPQNQAIGGQTVSYSLEVGGSEFHGPATYHDGFTSLVVGHTLFGGGQTTVTINSDGSGSTMFSGATDSAGQTESGTISWTCAGG